jgi:AGZA family xanthine/uracil permease-like MFS transporter
MAVDFFELRQRNTNVRIETVAGITTFLTMAYIIVVNPSVLSLEGTSLPPEIERMDKEALITVTCVVTALSTIIVGLFAKAPISMAPGMGLNAFFAYTLVLTHKIPWQTALGVVFLSGLFFLVLTLLGLRKRLVEAIPGGLIAAISVGIGLFITFIGLVNLGVVVGNPATLVSAGPMTGTMMIGLAGLVVMIFLEIKKVKGSLLIGIVFATALAAVSGLVPRPTGVLSSLHPAQHWENLSRLALHLDILAALKWSLFGSIFSLMFMDLFDSIGTLVACCHEAKMVDESGKIKGLDRLLSIDAIATMLGAAFGTSTTTSYIESAAGIEQGGRSGLTAVVTGLLFLLALVFVPIVKVVPSYATAPALIMVGLFMIRQIREINFGSMEEGFPAFIIIVMIALSYSISTGLAFGFVSFVILKLLCGKVADIKPAMWIIAVLSLVFLGLERLPDLVAPLGKLL